MKLSTSLAMTAIFAAMPAAALAQASDAVVVNVATVLRKDVPVFLDYVGTTEAVRSVVLQSKASGFLGDRVAADGADVKKGDLLYRIDPRDYQATLDQVMAQARRNQAALEYARINQGRNSTLAGRGVVSKDAFDLATSNLHQAEANVAADDAAVRTARLNLAYTEIRAPFDGRLGRSQIFEGALVSANSTTLNTLVQLDPLNVTMNVSETDLPAIQTRLADGGVAAEVRITPDAPASNGEVTFLDNSVDRATGTVAARVTIDNANGRLLPGQFTRVRLRVDELKNALLAPQVAIGSNQIGKYVYVIGADNKAERRPVILGAAQGALVIVNGGLKEGDRVATSNLQRLNDGTSVKPDPAGAKNGS